MSPTGTAELLRTWATRLCSARSGTPADLAAALAVPLDPPPPGVLSVHIRGGDIPLVELELGDRLPLGDLDRLLGAGNRLPRVDWDRPHVVAFTIAVPRAPYVCVLLANSDQTPSPTTLVTHVTLRLDRQG